MRIEDIRLFKCSFGHAPSEFSFKEDKAVIANGNIEEGSLICKKCGRRFPVKNGVPDLLPTEIQGYLESTKKGKLRPSLPKKYRRLVEQILAMEKMSGAYRQLVADPHTAAEAAVQYEKYEDIVLRKTFEKLLKRSERDHRGIVFIEVGSGPGRYLVQYGSKISADRNACARFRQNGESGDFYSFSPKYEENLKLILGIDFSEGMIRAAIRWLEENQLDDLLFQDRIMIVKAAIQYLDISFKNTPYENCYKIVACAFQTLGNQTERSLQVDLLKKMRTWAEPNGIVLVSVFNKSLFQHYFEPYYESIEGTIGPILKNEKEHEEGVLRTEWGVYSRWFSKEHLRDLFYEAGMKKATIRAGSGFRCGLSIYKDQDAYLPASVQRLVRERAIIGTFET